MPLTPDEYGASVHRTAFLEALVKHLDPDCVRLSKKCVSISDPDDPSARATIHFEDGTSAAADVILLANGMKCPQRKIVTGIDPQESIAFSNTVCYRGLVTRESAAAKGVDTSFWDYPTNCLGTGKVNESCVLFASYD